MSSTAERPDRGHQVQQNIEQPLDLPSLPPSPAPFTPSDHPEFETQWQLAFEAVRSDMINKVEILPIDEPCIDTVLNLCMFALSSCVREKICLLSTSQATHLFMKEHSSSSCSSPPLSPSQDYILAPIRLVNNEGKGSDNNTSPFATVFVRLSSSSTDGAEPDSDSDSNVTTTTTATRARDAKEVILMGYLSSEELESLTKRIVDALWDQLGIRVSSSKKTTGKKQGDGDETEVKKEENEEKCEEEEQENTTLPIRIKTLRQIDMELFAGTVDGWMYNDDGLPYLTKVQEPEDDGDDFVKVAEKAAAAAAYRLLQSNQWQRQSAYLSFSFLIDMIHRIYRAEDAEGVSVLATSNENNDHNGTLLGRPRRRDPCDTLPPVLSDSGSEEDGEEEEEALDYSNSNKNNTGNNKNILAFLLLQDSPHYPSSYSHNSTFPILTPFSDNQGDERQQKSLYQTPQMTYLNALVAAGLITEDEADRMESDALCCRDNPLDNEEDEDDGYSEGNDWEDEEEEKKEEDEENKDYLIPVVMGIPVLSLLVAGWFLGRAVMF